MDSNWKKNIALFLGAQTVSLFGSSLVQYAMSWYVALETQSGSMMTIAILCGVLPTFFVSPFGGVLADRFNRKHLINIADAAIAISTLMLTVFFMAGFKYLRLLFIFSAIRAVGAGIQSPAIAALIPQITPPQYLTKVNGINSGIQSFTMLISPMLAALLLSFASITSIFFIDVITAAIGISILFFCVKVEVPQNAERTSNLSGQKVNYFDDLKKGFIYIRQNKYIKHFCIFEALFYFAATPMAFLSVIQINRNFGSDVWRLSAMEIVFSSGMLLGGLLISVWGGFKNRLFTMALSCAIRGIGGVLLGIDTHFWFYLVCMGFIGVTMPLYDVPIRTILQDTVEESFMGRVFGVFTMIATLLMPMGMLIFGPLSDIISIDILQIICGVFILILSVVFIMNKTLQKAGSVP
ncbi:MAG: MFS transporter [Termitinemataceae bacterium]|nr:MAG: MFS transporter [Termitinemataceae bacterium]